MATTVQVSNDTKRLLEQMKESSSKTYDEIIKDLLAEKIRVRESLFGTHKELSAWTKKDRARVKNE